MEWLKIETVRKNKYIYFISLWAIINFIWVFILDFPSDSLYGANDFHSTISHLINIQKASLFNQRNIYNSFQFGGNVTTPFELPIYFWILSYFKLTPIKTINVSIVFTQVLVAYSITNIIKNINEENEYWRMSSLIGLVAAFLPFMGWRIGYGHLNIIWGFMPFLALLNLYLEFQKKQISYLGIFFTLITYLNCIGCISVVQVFIYSALIVGAMYVFFFLKIPKKNLLRFILINLVLITASFLMFNTQFNDVLKISMELKRNLSTDMIYTYNVENVKDFIASIFYFHETINTGRDPYLLHEANLGYGPLYFLCIILLIFKKKWKLLGFFVFFITIGFAISSNSKYIAQAILALLPILKAFRCPSRFFIPLNVLTLITIGVFYTSKIKKNIQYLGLLSMIFIWPVYQMIIICKITDEILIISTLVIFTLSILKKNDYIKIIFLIFFFSTTLLSFKNKIPENRLSEARFNDEIKFFKKFTMTNSLLEHSSSQLQSKYFGPNSSIIFNYSSVEGYNSPTSRFYDFYFAIRGGNIPGFNYFEINSQYPWFKYYADFFNITSELKLENNQWILSKIKDSNPFYLPSKISIVHNPREVLEKFNPNITALVEPEFSNFKEKITRCTSLEINNLNSELVDFSVKNMSEGCIIIFPTQYSSFLEIKSYNNLSFLVFPVNWVQTGIFIPKGEFRLLLSGAHNVDNLFLYPIIGLFLFIVFSYLLIKQKIFQPID